MFTLAIVGKPNVGKSTLFNRLCGKRIAIVDDMPGVTRDKKNYKGELGGLEFNIIDTAGWEREKEFIKKEMVEQSLSAAKEANVILFVVDMQKGLSPDDMDFAKIVRKTGVKIILLLNKSEGNVSADKEIYKLGFNSCISISAKHGLGMDELYHELLKYKEDYDKSNSDIEEVDIADEIEKGTKIAIIGRPNVGKSTIFNSLVGYKRTVVSDVSGTTRDSINHNIEYKGQDLVLIDTAGLRKKKSVDDQVEFMSIGETINAIRRCHVAVLVVDAASPLEKQDLTIANVAINEGKPLVVVINKYDLIEDKAGYRDEIEYKVDKHLFSISGMPIVYTAAINQKNISKILDRVLEVEDDWKIEISTGKLNRWIQGAIARNIPPLSNDGRRIKVKYITQIGQKPPTFKIFSNVPEDLPESYNRYLVNSMREKFGMKGVPIRFYMEKNKNPYHK